MGETIPSISPRVIEYVTLINLFQGMLLLFILLVLLVALYSGRLHGRDYCDSRTEAVVISAIHNLPIRWMKHE